MPLELSLTLLEMPEEHCIEARAPLYHSFSMSYTNLFAETYPIIYAASLSVRERHREWLLILILTIFLILEHFGTFWNIFFWDMAHKLKAVCVCPMIIYVRQSGKFPSSTRNILDISILGLCNSKIYSRLKIFINLRSSKVYDKIC